MSRRPAWCCTQCRHQLGEVVDGCVRVWAPEPMVGPDATSVICPRCKTPNVWHRQSLGVGVEK